MTMLPFLIATVVLTAVAAWIDYRTGEIPNWLTLGALALAPIAHIANTVALGGGFKPAALAGLFSILGALMAGLVPFMLFARGAIGGGDVKLFAAIGALLRPMWGVEAEVYGFVAAALIAPARLAYEGKLLKTLKNATLLLLNPFLPKKKKIPVEPTMLSWFRMGPAIFIGCVITLLLHYREQ